MLTVIILSGGFFDKAGLGIAADAPKEQEVVIAPDSNRILNGSMELVDVKTGNAQNWSFISKDPAGKGFLDTTRADNGANPAFKYHLRYDQQL